jgi:uncharacterized protein DUF4270
MVIEKRIAVLLIVFVSIFWLACSRSDIHFGNVPDNNYSNLVYIDTVEPKLSTFLLDSFVTNNGTSFLVGRYKDPYLGIVSTKPFFQMTIPAQPVTIASTSQFDSACLIVHLNKYYYGDTSRAQTFYVDELAQAINYTYNNNLYNTSDFPVKPVSLGRKTVRLRPSVDDSISIRLSDAKGVELFQNLQTQAEEVTNDDSFQNYFKGIRLSVNDADTTSVYGLNAATINLRIYYHATVPFPVSSSIDFPVNANSFSFNQILTDRTGTLLNLPSTKEYPSELTNGSSFTQYGAGVLLKLTFPSIKGILSTDKIVKLQKAVLVIRPMGQTYEKLKLPGSLYLAQTDATNTIGAVVGTAAPPVVDEIYGLDTYYKIDVTSFINGLLTTTGADDRGVFAVEGSSTREINRAVIGNGKQAIFKTQLQLTIFTVNK